LAHTIFYARVSTAEQTLEHQVAQAERAGFVIDEVVADKGVSGVATRLCERPEGKRLYDKLRSGDVLVVRWVDRLGRSYTDVTEVIREFMARGVIIKTVINGMVFDGATTDAMQMAVRDALISFLAATAQAQAEAIREAQKAGIAHAKGRQGKYRGRKPSYTREQIEQLESLPAGMNTTDAARATGLSRQTVLRIRANPIAAYARVAKWEVEQS
jgi:DNA invertase Pin-like site-specific DNA recombinase